MELEDTNASLPEAAEAPGPNHLTKAQKIEFRLRLMQQLTTVSLAGTGLAVTLLGTQLDKTQVANWYSPACFSVAAFLAIVGQMGLSREAEADGKPLPSSQVVVGLVAFFIGAGVATLALSVAEA